MAKTWIVVSLMGGRGPALAEHTEHRVQIEGGALAFYDQQGNLSVAYGPGSWLGIEPKPEGMGDLPKPGEGLVMPPVGFRP